MATRQMHRMAGKPYNVLRKVEIPVELQVKDDGAFLNELYCIYKSNVIHISQT